MATNEGGDALKASGAEQNREKYQGKAAKRRRIRLPARLVAVSWQGQQN
jgi:hypothetical protein